MLRTVCIRYVSEYKNQVKCNQNVSFFFFQCESQTISDLSILPSRKILLFYNHYEMATSLDYSTNLSGVVLDLDLVSNVGHPCWEVLDPNPNIIKLFRKYNKLFFDNVLEYRADVGWAFLTDKEEYTAGLTKSPPRNRLYGKIQINLNENVLKNRSRRELVEILIVCIRLSDQNPCFICNSTHTHTQISAWNDSRLFESHEEWRQGWTWEEFQGKNDGNKCIDGIKYNGNLNLCWGSVQFVFSLRLVNVYTSIPFWSHVKISPNSFNLFQLFQVHHEFFERINDKKKGTFVEKHDKWWCWRCLGDCRYKPPYFGFIWVNEDREPSSNDGMWIDRDQCAHQFEKYGDTPKEWLTQWECIIMFNQFVSDSGIRIKAKGFESKDGNSNRTNDDGLVKLIINSDDEDEFGGCSDLATASTSATISKEHYVNFDRETKKFISVDNYLRIDSATQNDSRTGCMLCLGEIANDKVIEHLYTCTGIEYSLDSGESLPIFRIDKN